MMTEEQIAVLAEKFYQFVAEREDEFIREGCYEMYLGDVSPKFLIHCGVPKGHDYANDTSETLWHWDFKYTTAIETCLDWLVKQDGRMCGNDMSFVTTERRKRKAAEAWQSSLRCSEWPGLSVANSNSAT